MPEMSPFKQYPPPPPLTRPRINYNIEHRAQRPNPRSAPSNLDQQIITKIFLNQQQICKQMSEVRAKLLNITEYHNNGNKGQRLLSKISSENLARRAKDIVKNIKYMKNVGSIGLKCMEEIEETTEEDQSNGKDGGMENKEEGQKGRGQYYLKGFIKDSGSECGCEWKDSGSGWKQSEWNSGWKQRGKKWKSLSRSRGKCLKF